MSTPARLPLRSVPERVEQVGEVAKRGPEVAPVAGPEW